MKLSFTLILMATLPVSAFTYGQNISVSYKNTGFVQVLEDLQTKTTFNFIYSDENIKGARPVTLSLQNQPVEAVLKEVSKGQPFDLFIDGSNILVRRKVAIRDRFSAGDTTVAPITGVVRDTAGRPLPAVTVRVKNSTASTFTDGEGRFVLSGVPPRSTLVFTSVGLETQEYLLGGSAAGPLAIMLKIKASDLQEVVVKLNTGYQELPAERATGSFVQVSNELFDRRVGTNVLDRLEGIASGVIFNSASNRVGNDPAISIRGRSTIFANTEPLVILDNFPYNGNINNINPNDVESITILKDASAAAVWGARAGNGVIVITSKKGNINKEPQVTFNTNLTVGDKPNIFYPHQLTSSQFIDLEKFLYDKKRYESSYYNVPQAPISPVVDIYYKIKDGKISQAEGEVILDKLRTIDTRDNFSKYFLQNSINQQYSLSISGGGARNRYYVSGGYDKIRSSSIGNISNRFTINATNTIYLLKNKIELTTGVIGSISSSNQNLNSYEPLLPYEQVISEAGEHLSVQRTYRQSYIDTISTNLLDWNYRPLDERNANSHSTLQDYRINVEVKYQVLLGLKIGGNYQYGKVLTTGKTLNDLNSYVTRNLINTYTQIDYSNNTVSRAIPLGAIGSFTAGNVSSHFGRAFVEYNRTFSGEHQLDAIAGFEVNSVGSFSQYRQVYGYLYETATDMPVDYLTFYPTLPKGGSARIPYSAGQGEGADRFRSIFFSSGYSFRERYNVSLSARKDESNLFGVKANQRGVPLWSAGVSWVPSNESFYKIKWLPHLKVRLTYGFTGNVDRSVTAFTTARVTNALNNYGIPFGTIINPPNPGLKWEKVAVQNIGVDFHILKSRIMGSADFYRKNGQDLIGRSPISPQTGVIEFTGNTSSIKTKGWDIQLSTVNIKIPFLWKTDFMLSKAKDVVTKYRVKQATNAVIIAQNYMGPVEGKPYSALFSYPWAGLDTIGDPQFYLDGKITKNYTEVQSSTNVANLDFSGTTTPIYFGSIRNSFNWKGIGLSFNILYKFDYYFRRPSINYNSLFGGSYKQRDFEKRWQNLGDENFTTVPAMTYPANGTRDGVYSRSSILIEPGDHIRFQDFRLSYDWVFKTGVKSSGKATVYFYLNNVGMIYRANNARIDPDDVTGGPEPKTYAIGARITL